MLNEHTRSCSLQVMVPFNLTWDTGTGKKTTLQFLSERWPNGSYGKAEPTVNNRKETENSNVDSTVIQVWAGTWEGKIKSFWGQIWSQNWLKRTDWQRTWFELLWHWETCSYLARAPPAGRGTELHLLVQLQAASRSLWIRPGRGKELWQSKSLVKHTMGAKGPVLAQPPPKAIIFVQSRFSAVR